MYESIFIVGVALIGVMSGGSNAIVSANAIDNYSYVNARDSGVPQGVQIARCVTGLGPGASEDNSALGGVYFNGSRLAFESCGGSSRLVHPRAAGLGNLGVINIMQCNTSFTTTLEGIYTCTMINSSMMEQSIKFGVYFNVRSESLDLYMPSFNHLYPLHSCSTDRCTIIICYNCYYWLFPHIELYLTRFSPRYLHMEEG